MTYSALLLSSTRICLRLDFLLKIVGNPFFTIFFRFSTNKILRFVFPNFCQRKPNIKQTLIFKVCRTHQKRRGKIQTGENHVRQGLSKVFVFFTYSSRSERNLHFAPIRLCLALLFIISIECVSLLNPAQLKTY